ncbi:MAG: DUF4886 domain-containing protein [Bacteroidales bacterium]|nr:DUF4886 domain-containing protein [Bacteroidales bacterium]
MKKIIALFVAALVCVVSYAQADTLRILAIGNSFSEDGLEYLPDLLEAAGVHNVIVGKLYIGGCSLERHCREYRGDLKNYRYSKSVKNEWVKEEGVGILRGIEDEPWDIVTMQQNSGSSGIYETYNPWFGELVSIVRKHCSNTGARIYWHQTWAYSRNSDHREFPKYGRDQKTMYEAILDCNRRLLSDNPAIAGVIPDGASTMFVRTSKLNDSKDITRDGYHQNYQYGRYTLACTWYEALVAPFTGKSVKGNKCLLKASGRELSPKAARICQKAACKAVRAPFATYEAPYTE